MKFIDLFAGIGGFRLGMEMAGHECVGHCEIDKFADKSYRAMHNVKEDEWYAADIRTVDPNSIPEFDCICGGFPCQSFSIAGKRGGFEDTRGTLFFEIARIIQVRKPKLVFLENVAGLLNHENGSTFETIIRTLGELGYWYEYQVLNSKHFGVPQNRERVFIIGHLRGTSGRKVFPIKGTDGKTLKKLIDGMQGYRVYDPEGASCALVGQAGGLGAKTGLYIIGKDGKEKKKDYASCLTGGGNSGGNHSDMDLLVTGSMTQKQFRASDTSVTLTAAGPSRGRGNGSPVPAVMAVLTPNREEKRQNGRRMKDPGEEMFTLTAQDRHGVAIKPKHIPGPNETNNTLRASGHQTPTPKHNFDTIHDGVRIRRLTPRECFRLQGFPDEYFDRAAAVNSDSQLYKQAGNSVTVNVVYEIANKLGKEG